MSESDEDLPPSPKRNRADGGEKGKSRVVGAVNTDELKSLILETVTDILRERAGSHAQGPSGGTSGGQGSSGSGELLAWTR